jgi:alkanesulfonate monooxygenase SsuD/methylene tetrahydromethanopterin reductase-like flavin-dependent oxidoreductase (luciferase family)
MHYALNLPPAAEPKTLVDIAVAAEAGGWDAVFLWDHLHLVRAEHLEIVDPWVTLGAIAARTERIRLGPLVTPLARRRPWVVAKEIVTLDHLSNGRVIFGVGLGAPPEDEFGAFGEPTDARERADRLDEGLAILEPLLRGEPVRHDGRYFHVDAEFRPAAKQRPRPPIWVAALEPNRRPLARALRYDGVAPIARDAGPIRPDALAAHLDGVARPARFDVVVAKHWEHSVAEYEAVGATWIVESAWPTGDWAAQLRRTAEAGPAMLA